MNLLSSLKYYYRNTQIFLIHYFEVYDSQLRRHGYALVTTIESTQNIFASALDYFWKMPVMYNRNFKPKIFADVTMLAK